MIFNSSTWLRRSFFGRMSIYYFVAVFFFGIMQQHKIPSMPLFFMQISAIFVVIMFSYIYSKKSIGVTCTAVFVFQLFTVVALRMFNYDYFHNPLGFNPMDAEWYDWMATQFVHRSLREFNMFLDSVDILLDDRGFNYIVLLTYKLAGSPARGVNLLLFFNVIAVTVSSYFMYRLAREFVDEKNANFACFVWGTQLYSVYTAAVGLKENFMVCFVVIALYFITKLWREYSLRNVILALLFASSALLFRTALFYILIMGFLTVTAVKFPFIRRYIIFFMVLGLVFTLYYLRQAAQEVSEIRGHAIDQETYETLVAGKMERSGSFSAMVNYISALIGPFPNIVAAGDKANYITLFSFSSFCKTFYAFFFVYSLYLVIKNKVVKFVPLMVFWGLDILMLILTFYTLHDRYHWPHVPIVVLMSVWGGEQWMTKKPKNAKLIYNAYMVALFLILVMFNYR